MRRQGLGVRDLIPLMDTDPRDDLSGLRLLADRMNPVIWHEQPSPAEPEMTPQVAEHWLLTSRRMKIRDGILILTDTDHVSKAGFRIATG
jgi:hypothetical protein